MPVERRTSRRPPRGGRGVRGRGRSTARRGAAPAGRRERAGERDTLRLAAGQVGRRRRTPNPARPTRSSSSSAPGGACVRRHAGHLQSERDVVEHRRDAGTAGRPGTPSRPGGDGWAQVVTSTPSISTVPRRARRGRRSPAGACSCRCPTARAGRRAHLGDRQRHAVEHRRAAERDRSTSPTSAPRPSRGALRSPPRLAGGDRRARRATIVAAARISGEHVSLRLEHRARAAEQLLDGDRHRLASAASEEAGRPELAERDRRRQPGADRERPPEVGHDDLPPALAPARRRASRRHR